MSRPARLGYNRWIRSASPEETMRLGEKFGRTLRRGAVVSLVGGIGSGKTTFTRGLARGLGITDPTEVTSPTFVLVKEYPCRVPLYHADLYRLEGVAGADRRLLEELMNREGVTVVEWGDRAGRLFPPGHFVIAFAHDGEDRRKIRFRHRRRE